VVDGVNGEVFQQMLRAAQLPAIQKYFVDRGLYVPRAVANIPSVTLANLTSLVTGLLPGHHGVTGNMWFDRQRYIYRDYNTLAQKNTLDGDYDQPTIFELARRAADGENPGPITVSIFLQPHRGTTKFFENALSAVGPFVFGWYDWVDRITLFRMGEMMSLARKAGRFPLVTYLYLLNPDYQGYTHGQSSPQYRQALIHTDRQIGRVLGDLARAGVLDKIVIALTSDHSMGDVKHHFDIEKFLASQAGLKLARGKLWENASQKQRLRYYDKFNAVVYRCGDRYAALCLRRPLVVAPGQTQTYAPWPGRPGPDDLQPVVKKLVAQEAIDAVAWATGTNRCRVSTTRGTVEFAQPTGPGGDIAYSLTGGTDPLGWEGKVSAGLLGGQWASPRVWLEATNKTDYPDLPTQILAYFRAPRRGDVVAFASPGWDFLSANRAGHGGIRAYDDMHVPLLLAGPGVPHETVPTARTVDLVPTLLQLLKIDNPDHRANPAEKSPKKLDGQSLIKTP
jgi:arylsulfatase A-like enzyme